MGDPLSASQHGYLDAHDLRNKFYLYEYVQDEQQRTGGDRFKSLAKQFRRASVRNLVEIKDSLENDGHYVPKAPRGSQPRWSNASPTVYDRYTIGQIVWPVIGRIENFSGTEHTTGTVAEVDVAEKRVYVLFEGEDQKA